MTINISATVAAGTQRQAIINAYPDTCPVCHVHVQPTSLGFIYQNAKNEVQGLFRCTNTKCDQAFIATYTIPSGSVHNLAKTEPFRFTPHTFPKEISDVSPLFVEIYNQAMAAQAASLDQMVGIGLRKALEFLIKDFAISEQPDKAEQIKAALLGNVIKQYIDDKRVQALAERAAWLGNDETHYVRKWETKDITDLKNLVTLTLNAVQNVILGRQYLKDMPPPAK